MRIDWISCRKQRNALIRECERRRELIEKILCSNERLHNENAELHQVLRVQKKLLVIARTGTEAISLLQRNRERPLQKLTDEELAALGALAGFAPMLRANVAEQLYVLGRLAGMEENRRADSN